MNGGSDGRDDHHEQLSSDSLLQHDLDVRDGGEGPSGSSIGSGSNGVRRNGSSSNGSALNRDATTLEDSDDGHDDHASAFTPLYHGSSIDKREFIRLTIQSLKELGFE